MVQHARQAISQQPYSANLFVSISSLHCCATSRTPPRRGAPCPKTFIILCAVVIPAATPEQLRVKQELRFGPMKAKTTLQCSSMHRHFFLGLCDLFAQAKNCQTAFYTVETLLPLRRIETRTHIKHSSLVLATHGRLVCVSVPLHVCRG